MRPDMTRDELVRTGQSYRDRQERDLRKHQEMVGYAEGRGCRWQTLLGYFGGEGLPDERCGHCDHCKRWALQGGTRAGAKAETGLAEKTGRTSTIPVVHALVPRLCLGTHCREALPRVPTGREAEPPGSAFPGRAWEREANFFPAFDVSFFHSRGIFEIRPASPSTTP